MTTMPRLRAPVVLVHGLFGFRRLRVGRWVLADYFHGVPRALESAGNRVFAPRLSPTRGIAERAAQLRNFIDLMTASGEPVHIVAHSMGGLDARYMIARLGMAPRVLSLTTLGTPHRGSAFADWAKRRLVPLVAPVFSTLGLSRQAFADLTVERCAAFNAEVPNAAGVRYFSVGGAAERRGRNPAWGLSSRIVERHEGPSDGIVSLASARWGEEFAVWPSDHMNLVNWPEPFRPHARNDRLPAYQALLGRLRDEGM